MPKTPSKMHMYDMVKIDDYISIIKYNFTIYKIVGGGSAFKAPSPPGLLTV